MNPKLWRAIDRIGSRKASRFEWETVSGLPWSDLEPFLRLAPGRAEEVPDPEDDAERLAVWDCEDGRCLLESQHFPAHRSPIEVERFALGLHRLNITAISSTLAELLNFIPQRPVGQAPLFTVGFVQEPGAKRTGVALFVPASDPLANAEALAASDSRNHIMLIPTSRWARKIPERAEARVLEQLFASRREDHLVNVAISAKAKLSSRRLASQPLVQVRQEDRWENVCLSFNPSNGFLRIRVGKRRGEIRVWDPSSDPSNDALILEVLTTSDPPAWSVAVFTGKKKRSMQRGFQRFTERLKEWVPIVDGEPFAFDPSSGLHTPRFKVARKN